MDLSLAFLKSRIEEVKPVTLVNERRGQKYRGVKILGPDAKLQKGFLYFWQDGAEELLKALDDGGVSLEEGAGVVMAGNAPDDPKRFPAPMLCFSGAQRTDTFNLICEIFDSFNEWGERVYQKALGKMDLVQFMNLLNEVTPNPWYIADASYRVLAARDAPEVEELSYIWRFLYQNKRLPIETIFAMEDMGKIEQMSKRKKAYIPATEPFNIPFVSKSIMIPDGEIAHFYLIGVYTRLSQYEIEIADFFGDILNRVFAREGSGLPAAGRFYDSFLSDLITGDVSDESSNVIGKMYADFSWTPTDHLRMAVFSRLDKSGSISDEQRVFLLESHCNSRGFFHDGRVAAIINTTRSCRNAEDDDDACLALLRPLVREFNCSVGVSEVFSGLAGVLQLGMRYDQALFALGASERPLSTPSHSFERSSPIVLFSSVAMRYFQERVVQADAISIFEHPSLAILRSYDTEKETELYKTLQTFLENDRNVTTTAGLLFVHRNTLLKRLKKIASITTLDLDDGNCRRRLSASFLIAGNAHATRSDT